MSVAQVRAEREAREAVAAERAATLSADEYFADGNFVATWYDGGIAHVIECESHWDACLVLLAFGKAN